MELGRKKFKLILLFTIIAMSLRSATGATDAQTTVDGVITDITTAAGNGSTTVAGSGSTTAAGNGSTTAAGNGSTTVAGIESTQAAGTGSTDATGSTTEGNGCAQKSLSTITLIITLSLLLFLQTLRY